MCRDLAGISKRARSFVLVGCEPVAIVAYRANERRMAGVAFEFAAQEPDVAPDVTAVDAAQCPPYRFAQARFRHGGIGVLNQTLREQELGRRQVDRRLPAQDHGAYAQGLRVYERCGYEQWREWLDFYCEGDGLVVYTRRLG